MANKKVTRPGAGRTKGSFSFVKVPLDTLVAKFADTKQEIVVGRKWAEAMQIKATAQAATELNATIEGTTPGTGVASTEVAL